MPHRALKDNRASIPSGGALGTVSGLESPSYFVGQRPVLCVSDWAIESQPHL